MRTGIITLYEDIDAPNTVVLDARKARVLLDAIKAQYITLKDQGQGPGSVMVQAEINALDNIYSGLVGWSIAEELAAEGTE